MLYGELSKFVTCELELRTNRQSWANNNKVTRNFMTTPLSYGEKSEYKSKGSPDELNNY